MKWEVKVEKVNTLTRNVFAQNIEVVAKKKRILSDRSW